MQGLDTVNDRYVLGRLLGSGATGLVHEAHDRLRGARVAVKRLRRDGPLDVARLKREFRTLADVVHPNLVRLLELDGDRDEVLLAMELIEGRPLLRWVRGDDPPPADTLPQAGTTWSTLAVTPIGGDLQEEVRARPSPGLDPAAIGRLRTALRGLARGISALHAAGLLHRDIKPSNVLVTEAGHVVVLDFGLATRPDAAGSGLAGTVGYMAPEQIVGERLGPAADWYGVGSVLFEALTGRTPFVGSVAQVLFDKRLLDPPDVRELAPDAPADLAALCMALLRRDPAGRPDGDAVCRQLGVTPERADAPGPFVGRDRELDALREAGARGGRRVVHVRGRSGFGKTRLVEAYLADLDDAVVLAGRCYERERTPFKALDPLVDALADALVRLDPRELDRMVAVTIGAAVRMFPALARVPALTPGVPDADPVRERRRATDALRELLQQLARRCRTVLWIDDLQWGDLDSVRLLAAILRDPDPPPVLTILGWRSDDPHVDELLAPLTLPATRIALGPLPDHDARALVEAELHDEAGVARVLAEAGGSPFFLGELARWVASGACHGDAASDGPLLDRVVAARVEQLDPSARSVLEVVAVAGRPILPELALRAARAVTPDAGPADLALLTVRRLLTTRRGRALECTHDRIREAVTAGLVDHVVRARHRALAEAVGHDGDPEILSELWAGAGERERAADFALRGAMLAEEGLAFDRAVTGYRRALSLGAHAPDAQLRIEIRLGRALARAGRAEAADVLLAAASRAAAAERVVLEREAAHILLRCGHFDRAYALLPRVVGEVGMRWPGRVEALAELAWLEVRPSALAPRPRPSDRDALQLAMEVAMSMSYADMLVAAVFSARAIDLAERIGEPDTVALAAAMRGSNRALLGDLTGSARALERSRGALPVDAPERLRALVELHHGIAETVAGRFHDARARLVRVLAAFERAGGMPYETGMCQVFLAFALSQVGELAAFRALRARVVDDARARGDKHQEVLFRVLTPQDGLLDDDPEAALANLDEARSRWGEGLSTVWLYNEVCRAQVDLYVDRPRDALGRLRDAAGRARGSGLLRINLNALLLHLTTAAAAAPLAADDPEARATLTRAVRALGRVGVPLADAQARVWLAAARAAAGDRPGAVDALDGALLALAEAPAAWQEELVRAHRARLLDEDPSPWLDALRARGVARPERFSSLYVGSPALR